MVVLLFSTAFHTSNRDFSYYNIYRETTIFSSVAGLKPIASGKDVAELRNSSLEKWVDRFAPTGAVLFYAITIVNQKGKMTENVTPRQISFLGTFDDAGGIPARITPNVIKGNVLYHSVAYNNIQNEYFVVFDVDQNNDNTPDRVYGLRVNGLGQIANRRLIDFTMRGNTTEQGHPTVAFNPSTQEYLVAWHLSGPLLHGGAHVIIGQRMLLYRNVVFGIGSPYIVVNPKLPPGCCSIIEPKLMYDLGSGGYVMTAMLLETPMNAIIAFIKPNGKNSTAARVFTGGEVLEASPFIDTKHGHIYVVYQVPQRVSLGSGQNDNLKDYPYKIVLTKIKFNAAGIPVPIGEPRKYLVGYTNERNANIDAYFNEKSGWLTLFWNNRKNGAKVISSSSVIKVRKRFRREMTTHGCPQHVNVQNSASCYLPANNGHIMIWEEGDKLGGYLVKDGAFNPVLGTQRRAKVLYNSRDRKAFVVYQQTVNGSRTLFVRNIAPGSQPVCSTPCKSSERCLMKDVCTPRNPVAVNNAPTCLKDKGGCSHTCTSLAKGRTCSCPPSYTLALDGMKCILSAAKPDVSLLYATPSSIWSMSVYHAEKHVSFAQIPIKGEDISSFFYNEKDKYLYWADEKKIYKSHLDGTNMQVIVNNQVSAPLGMVVDPESKQLYWADFQVGTIFRSLLDGANVASFITGLDQPQALVLHKEKRWLFWVHIGEKKIERINTDGTNRVVLIQTGLMVPLGLARDEKYLYWGEAVLETIEMSDFNGKGRITLTSKALDSPFVLGIAGHRLYWSAWSAGHIYSLDERNASLPPDEIVAGLETPLYLQIYNETAALQALPVFTTFPSNKTARVSYGVTIECSAETRSGGKATITWYKDGKPLGSSFRYQKAVTGYFHILHVLVDDDGLYTCEASNAAGKIQASMYLTVRQKQIACGKAKVKRPRGKIFGGYRPRRGSIPWQILLFDNDENAPFCGAVLLNERWAVTAAHCFKMNGKEFKINDVVAILGEHNWKKDDNTEQKMAIAQLYQS